jgi:acetyltransferase
MTNGGGAGVMAADAAAQAGVALAPLPPAMVSELDAHLPANWSRANPIDLIGDAPVERYVATLRALLAQPGGASVLFMHAPTAIVRSDEIARPCVPLLRAHPGRVLACWLGGSAVAAARRLFEEAGAAVYDTPEEAVRAWALLATYRRNQALLLQAPPATPASPPDRAAAAAVLASCAAAGGGWLDADGVRAVLAAYGLPQVPQRSVPPAPDAAAAAAAELGFPVALKIRSPDLTHKSDLGGVVLDIADAPAVRAAAAAMLERVGAARPGARLEGFVVQPMVQRRRACELIVGATVDAVFGPVLLFGQGGTAVELLADRAVALPPLDAVLARELVARTRVARLLGGWRDQAPADMEALVAALMAVAQLLADQPLVAELDINPLLADARGVLALDARIRVATAPCGGAERFAIRPYPDALEQRGDWHGRPLLLRPIRPDDGERHRAFVERLSPEDLRLRFFGPRHGVPRQELARLTQIDYEREMAFVAVAPDAAGREETLGVARCVSDPDNVEAEFALVVRSDLQHRGLGRLLLARLIDYARAHGTRRLVGLVLRENRAMLALCAGLGFVPDRHGSDADALRLVLPLQAASEPAG